MGSVDICIFTECPLMRLFSSLPTPPFHHLAGFSHNFFSFPSLSQICARVSIGSQIAASTCKDILTRVLPHILDQRYVSLFFPIFPLLPRQVASLVLVAYLLLSLFLSTNASLPLPALHASQEVTFHSIPKTVIGFPVGGFHTPFLCFLKRTALLDFTAQSPSVFSLSVFSITLSSHTFNASSPDFSSSSILSSAFIQR